MRIHPRPIVLVAFLFLMVLPVGCGGDIEDLDLARGTVDVLSCPGGDKGSIDVQYLGVGGFLIKRENHAVLTAPFYSNPRLSRVGMGLSIRPDHELIDKLIPRDLENVTAILVGHTHYDHLMDLPYIASKYAKKAKIYGSNTMAHILAAPDTGIEKDRVVALNSGAGNWRRPGEWLPSPASPIRFMALYSQHAPHFLGFKAYGGKLDRDREELPDSAYGWKEGQTFAFIIDFLAGDGSVDFRIHYQDAAANPPYGFLPLLDGPGAKKIDLAIVCVAAFDQVDNYPEGIIRDMRPRHVILGHWENFFRPQTEPLEEVPFTDTAEFVIRLKSALPEGSTWNQPKPGTTLRFKQCS